MTTERFLSLVEAYGADARRWPEGERAAMQAFVLDHPVEAERALVSERALDALLDEAAPVAASDLLHARILAAVPRPGSGQVWRGAAAAAAALIVGVAGGYSAAAVSPTEPVEAELFAGAFDGLDPDWSLWEEFET